MQDQFKKYLDNQCSKEEVEDLLAYFNVPGNEITLRALITESLENTDVEDDGSKWQFATNKTLDSIKKQIATEKTESVPSFKKTWFKVAAAVMLVAGGVMAYQLNSNSNKYSPEIAVNDKGEKSFLEKHSMATLTLADGSAIDLETVAKGNIAQQSSIKIIKSEEGTLTYVILSEKPTDEQLNTMVTPRGGQYQIVLSDGTKAWLNAASSIKFPAAFVGEERRVQITGEVYFEVAKIPSIPFRVNVDDKADVEVLGTHFNVNAYENEAAVRTTLIEGSVKVTALAMRDSTIITPGEQAVLPENGRLEVNTQVNLDQAVAWKNGVFNFNDAGLETVLKQISRWYDVDIEFEGTIPQRKFNGEIQRELELSQVIKLLEKNDVHFKLEGKKLIVLK